MERKVWGGGLSCKAFNRDSLCQGVITAPFDMRKSKRTDGAPSATARQEDAFECTQCMSKTEIPAHTMFARFKYGFKRECDQADAIANKIGDICWPCLERSKLYKTTISATWVLFADLRTSPDPHARYYYNTHAFTVPREYGDNFLVNIAWLTRGREDRLKEIVRKLDLYGSDQLSVEAEAMVKVFSEINYEVFGWVSDRSLRRKLRAALSEPLVPYSVDMLRREPSSSVKLFDGVKYCSRTDIVGVRDVMNLEALLEKRKEMPINALQSKFQEHFIAVCRAFLGEESFPVYGYSRAWLSRKCREQGVSEQDETDSADRCNTELEASPEYPATVFNVYVASVVRRITDL